MQWYLISVSEVFHDQVLTPLPATNCADKVCDEYCAYQCMSMLPQVVISATGVDGGTELIHDGII